MHLHHPKGGHLLTFLRPRYMLESRLAITSYDRQPMGEALLRGSWLLQHYDVALDGLIFGHTSDHFWSSIHKFHAFSGLEVAHVSVTKSLNRLQATYDVKFDEAALQRAAQVWAQHVRAAKSGAAKQPQPHMSESTVGTWTLARYFRRL